MYDLPHVVLCCILAVAAGADSYRAIVRFIDVRLGWLQQHTALGWRRAPSHSGLRAILLGLDQPALEQALRRRAKTVLAARSLSGFPHFSKLKPAGTIMPESKQRLLPHEPIHRR